MFNVKYNLPLLNAVEKYEKLHLHRVAWNSWLPFLLQEYMNKL